MCRLPDGRVCFVPLALPQERLTIAVTVERPSYCVGEKLAVVTPSPSYVAAPCPLFGACGGCSLQHLAYSAQLVAKASFVADALRRIGDFQPGAFELRPIIGVEDTLRGRNKLELTVRGGSRVGMLAASSDELVPVTSCLLQHEASDEVLSSLSSLIAASPVPNLRRVTLRTNEGGRVAVEFQAEQPPLRSGRGKPNETHNSWGQHSGLGALCDALVALHPCILSVVATTLVGEPAVATRGRRRQGGPSQQPPPPHRLVRASSTPLFGPASLPVTLGGITFDVFPGAFFQTNTRQAEALLALVAAAAELQPNDRLMDLFCGTAALSLPMAHAVEALRGWDVSAAAIGAAKRAAAAAGLAPKCDFVVGDLAAVQLAASGFDPSVVVCDPSRSGMPTPVVSFLRRCGSVSRIVAVSCDAATAARDLAALCCAGGGGAPFVLRSVQPLDMFPHSAHVETVALLTRDRGA